MAKKKELEKAMMGRIVKPVVRAISSGSKVVKNTKPKTTAIIGDAVKAGKKGYSREVATYKKAQDAKKAAKAPVISEEKRLMDDLNNQKKKTQTVNKSSTGKKKLTTKQKVGIGVATGAAVIGGVKYANRKRRTLND